jgi:hypothetical protein
MDYKLKTFTVDPTTKPVKYGASTEENPNYTADELQILETADILKFSYIHRRYKNDLNSSIFKQQMNVLRRNIGINADMSRNCLPPSLKLAGLKDDSVSKFYDNSVIIAYFNLHWVQRFPSEIANIVIDYMGLSHLGCRLCNVKNPTKKHFTTQRHRNNERFAPAYMIEAYKLLTK